MALLPRYAYVACTHLGPGQLPPFQSVEAAWVRLGAVATALLHYVHGWWVAIQHARLQLIACCRSKYGTLNNEGSGLGVLEGWSTEPARPAHSDGRDEAAHDDAQRIDTWWEGSPLDQACRSMARCSRALCCMLPLFCAIGRDFGAGGLSLQACTTTAWLVSPL